MKAAILALLVVAMMLGSPLAATDTALPGPDLTAMDAVLPHVEVFVAPHQLERITGQDALEHTWPGVRIAVYDLGAAARFEAELSAGLPAEPAQAQIAAQERIHALGEDLESHLQAAFGGLVRAARLDLDRLPAVVFNGQAIVYGITDLAAAHARYAEWLDAHR